MHLAWFHMLWLLAIGANSSRIHVQVEKSLEMKKCSRNGTKKTRYRNVYNVKSHTSMLDGFYLTTQYQGECGHIEGHANSVLH